MKRIKNASLVLFSFLSISLIQAQQKAITEIGDEVILYNDGTWIYQNIDQASENEIPINPEKFEKDEKSTFLLKSNNLNVGFWLNPKLWSFSKALESPDFEYQLQLREGDLYGLVITEQVEIPLKLLKKIALDNAREAAPDVKIIKEEYRTVNDLKVLQLQFSGTMQGLKFSYYGHYFSNENESVQFITYTSPKLLEKYKPEIEKLLNGLVEIN